MVQLRRYAAILLLSIGSLLGASPAVHAEQCIFNKGGYVLRVEWFRAGAGLGAPLRSSELALGTGTCNKSDEKLMARVSVVGCVGVMINGTLAPCVAYTLPESRTPARSLRYVDDAGNEREMLLQASHVCAGLPLEDRARCLGAQQNIPPSNRVWIGVPYTTRYLDFWGTVFNVEWGPGGPI